MINLAKVLFIFFAIFFVAGVASLRPIEIVQGIGYILLFLGTVIAADYFWTRR